MSSAPYSLGICCTRLDGELCALAEDGTVLWQRKIERFRLGNDLVPAIYDCFKEIGKAKNLAVSIGPGSFTGLRIGVLAVRNITWLEGIAAKAVDSLAARAYQAGPGTWWVWQTLKRDTTFEALYQVKQANNTLEVHPLTKINAQEDHLIPEKSRKLALQKHARLCGSTLTEKTDLRASWYPEQSEILDSHAEELSAEAIARYSQHLPALPWNEILPAYHQASAPELQRTAAQQKQHKTT